MAVVSFAPTVSGNPWTNLTLPVPGNLSANTRVALATSDAINNNNGQNALNINLTFHAVTPNVAGSSFELALVVEGKDATGNWFDLGYQFSPFKFLGIAPKQRIIIDPGVDTFNDGIPSIIYVGGSELTRISRQRGIVPPEGFRLCLFLTDSSPGVNGFQSVTCSVSGEKYDA